MANPSLKNGYLSIANELAEQFARYRIPGNEMQTLWVVLRKTWGWKEGNRKKDWDWIALSQFRKMTGLNQSQVVRSLKSLVSKKILLKGKNGYKINQNYDEWVVSKKIPSIKKDTGSIKSDTRSSIKSDTETSIKSDTNKRKEINIKETNTKETAPSGAERVNDFLGLFKNINPSYERFFSNNTQRAAAERLLKKFGFDAMAQLVKVVEKTNTMKYAPVITTPVEIEKLGGKLKAFIEKEKDNRIKNKIVSV